MKKILFAGITVALFTGCITTFQTAEVVSPGEEVVGGAAIIPAPLMEQSPQFSWEAYYRRGLARNLDLGMKADIIGSGLYGVYGDVKYQLLHRPLALSMLVGGGKMFDPSGGIMIFYPTLLAGGKHAYLGLRHTIWADSDGIKRNANFAGPYIVLGFSFNLLRGSMSIMPEVNIHLRSVNSWLYEGPLVYGGIAIQLNRGY